MNPKYLLVASAAALLQISVSTAGAAPIYWDGAATGGWEVASNWSTVNNATTPDPLAPPGAGDIATFNINGQNGATTVSLNGPQSVEGISFVGTSTIALQGGGANQTLSIGASGITANAGTTALNVGSGTANQNVNVSLLADQTWAFNGSNAQNTYGIFVRNTVSLGVSGDHTLTLGGTSGATAISGILGSISNGSGVLNIRMNGSGTNRWNLNADNSYTGTTTISAGALGIQTANGLGAISGGTTVATGAALFLRNGSNVNYAAEPLTLSGVGPSGSSARGALRQVGGGVSVWSGAITANATAGPVRIGADQGTLTIASTANISTTGSNNIEFEVGATGVINVNGSISGSVGVTKATSPVGGGTGTGVLNLTGNNSYSGATQVNVGVVSVTGTLTNTNSLLVESGAAIRGTGTINVGAPATINGTIGAGANQNSIGTLSLGALTLGGTGILSIDINTTTPNNDRLNVSGNLALDLANTATLSLNDVAVGSPLAIGTVLTLIDYSGTWNGGLLEFNDNPIDDDTESFIYGSNAFTIDYNGGVDSNDLRLVVVVPEPASSMILLGGLGALALRGRRRNRA